MSEDLGLKLQRYLMGSYAYYILNETIMPDVEYDMISKELLEGYDTFEHRHKYLISKDDLQAGSLYHIKEAEYPNIVKGAVRERLNKAV